LVGLYITQNQILHEKAGKNAEIQTQIILNQTSDFKTYFFKRNLTKLKFTCFTFLRTTTTRNNKNNNKSFFSVIENLQTITRKWRKAGQRAHCKLIDFFSWLAFLCSVILIEQIPFRRTELKRNSQHTLHTQGCDLGQKFRSKVKFGQ